MSAKKKTAKTERPKLQPPVRQPVTGNSLVMEFSSKEGRDEFIKVIQEAMPDVPVRPL